MIRSNLLTCSFCGKSQHEVKKLIAGPTVFVCDECVELCMDIIKDDSKKTSQLRKLVKRIVLHQVRNLCIFLMIM